jgi:hypothetical protein
MHFGINRNLAEERGIAERPVERPFEDGFKVNRAEKPSSNVTVRK